MKVHAPPTEIIQKTELMRSMKKIQPGAEFDRMLVNHDSRPCCVVLSIADWNDLCKRMEEMQAKASHYDAIQALYAGIMKSVKA